MKFAKLCPFCMETHTVELTDDQFKRYRKWKDGEGVIQELMYDLTPEERELLKTGICGKCWEEMMR